jgi:hypothetical protein
MSRYEDIEQRLADWLEEGPIGAPDSPIAAALAHARVHPRRRWSVVGHWRTLMNGTNMAQVGPKAPQAGWLYAAAAVLVLVVVVAAGYGLLQSNNSGVGTGSAPLATASPTATASPAAAVITGTESCRPRTDGTTSTVDGVKQERNQGIDCTTTMSDPRLTGNGSAIWNSDEHPDATYLAWGTRTITTDRGSWSGPYAIVSTSTATSMTFDVVLTGSGEYAGLVFRSQVVMSSSRTTFTGAILPAPATITGRETCTNDLSNRSEFTVDDITAYRGVVATCTVTMSDPRVTGAGRNEISIDMRSDQSADIWGRYALAANGGAWEGYWAGTVDEGYTTHRVESLLVGTGDYEGFLYRLSVVSDGTDTGFDLTGFIVPRS